MTGSAMRRRTVLGLAAVTCAALAGLALPAAAGTPAAPGIDAKPTHLPCRPVKDCPTDPPTPTPTPVATDPTTAPPPSDPASAGAPAPGTSATGASGQPVSGAVPGTAPHAGGPGAPAAGGAPVLAGPSSPDPVTGFGAPPRPVSVGSPTGRTLPVWPVLWGGTALIALVSAGLFLALWDRRAGPAANPVGGLREPDQGVPSPRGPIRLEWTEPPG